MLKRIAWLGEISVVGVAYLALAGGVVSLAVIGAGAWLSADEQARTFQEVRFQGRYVHAVSEDGSTLTLGQSVSGGPTRGATVKCAEGQRVQASWNLDGRLELTCVKPAPVPSPSTSPSPGPSPSSSPSTPAPPPGRRWVTGYYGGWHWPDYPVEKVNVKAMTHGVFGRYAPGGGSLHGTCGTLVEGAGTGHQAAELQFIKKLHDADRKALVMIGGGGDGPGFDCSTSTLAMRAAFIQALVKLVADKGYDGVDLDWEEYDSALMKTQFIALVTELRAALPAGKLITAEGFWTNINFKTVTPFHVQLASLVDQYNLMTYGMADTYPGWDSWHFAALYGAAPTHPSSVEAAIAEHVATGIPASKLGLGIGFYGLYYRGGNVTGPRQKVGESRVEGNDVENSFRRLTEEGAFKQPGSPILWDDVAKHTYITYNPRWQRAPNFPPLGFLSFESTKSIEAKCAFIQEKGLGGAMLWTIDYGALADGSNPLLEAVGTACLGVNPDPPSPPPTTPPSPVPSTPPTPPAPAGPIVGYGSQAAKGWESWPKARVTSVLPSGPGSIQAVLAAVPPGTALVFPQAGTVTLPCPGDGSYHIFIDKPNIVIDGLSAPAPGITVEQPKLCDQDNFKIKSGAKGVIVQGLRFRSPYKGGLMQGTNNQALPVVDGDSKPAATISDVVFYRNTFEGGYDSSPDVFGRVMNATFQANLWLRNRHPQSVTRGSDQGTGASVCRNDDGTYCHPDGVTWFRNARLENFERNPKIVVGDHIEIVNEVVYGWGAPSPTEGGGVGLQINPKSGPQYLVGSINVINGAYVDGFNRPDSGIVYGDIPKGTPENDGSKARAWLGNGGMVSRIFSAGNLMPRGRLYTKYNGTSTPGSGGKPFVPPAYAQIPAALIRPASDLENVIDEAGMPWPEQDEVEGKERAKKAYRDELAARARARPDR